MDVVFAGRVLRVTIERRPKPGAPPEDPARPSGWGVTLDDCADLSRDLSRVLDEDDFMPPAYTLEVSSPGLERELRGPEDFRRFQGFAARVKLRRPASDGQRLLRGVIASVDGPAGGEALAMRVDGKIITVPFEAVSDANLVYELPKAPAPPRRERRPAERSRRVTSRSSS